MNKFNKITLDASVYLIFFEFCIPISNKNFRDFSSFRPTNVFQFSINVIRTVNVVVFLNFFEFLLRSNTFSINVNENITVNTHTHTHKHNVMSFYLETRVQN